jgi:hypothetical protein
MNRRLDRMMAGVVFLAIAVSALLLTGTRAAAEHEEEIAGPNLKKLGDDHILKSIAYCRGVYTVTTADGRRRSFPEFKLRFKTDSSPNGPHRGKPVLIRAGMGEDRGFVIFGSLADFQRHVFAGCESERSGADAEKRQ